MNRNTVLVVAFLIPHMLVAQVGGAHPTAKGELVGQVGGGLKPVWVSLTKYKTLHEKPETYYVLTYNNCDYEYVNDDESIFFYATDEELEKLFNTMHDYLLDVKNRELPETITLDKHYKFVLYRHGYGGIAVTVIENGREHGFFYLNRLQLKRLFGKEKL